MSENNMNSITFNDGSQVYLTSDLHFRHGNIIRYNNRPFGTVQEQTEKLIENWNITVPDTATVFILGDFAFASKNQWKAILNQLTGKKYLLLGNHDRDHEIPTEMFEQVADLLKLTVKVDDQDWRTFILSHRPLLCWEGNERGTYMLYGHVHSSPTRDETCTNGDNELIKILDNYNTYDVGVDNNNYKPICILDVIKKINERKQKLSEKQ